MKPVFSIGGLLELTREVIPSKAKISPPEKIKEGPQFYAKMKKKNLLKILIYLYHALIIFFYTYHILRVFLAGFRQKTLFFNLFLFI